MSDPYIGEIRIFAGTFAPIQWAFCDGQLMPISEYDALYALIGTTYGGDGMTNFALPDLRGRVPVHQGQGGGLSTRVMGQQGGNETVTLSTNQLPAHAHPLLASSGAGTADTPDNNVWAAPTTAQFVPGNQANTSMSPATVGASGGSQPHDNMLPFQGVHFIIALFGIFPSQN